MAVSSLCRRYLLSFCNEPEKPRGSIKSALATKLTLWANPLIDRATARNDFDLRRFRREAQSLYIAIAPDDLQRLGPIVRLLIEFFLAANTKAGETPADAPALKVPVLMLLDEFLSLGRVEKLVHALAYVRGWGIRIATVIQSEAQLPAVYGRELAEFFIDNYRARVYYRPRCTAGTWPSRSPASSARRPSTRRATATARAAVPARSPRPGRPSSTPTRLRTCARTRPSS